MNSSMSILAALLVLTLSGILPRAAQAAPEDVPNVGDMPIRFYSGNLSVGRFMNYWGTANGDEGMLSPGQTMVLKRTGCTAMCDYTPWCVIEQEEGVWDFSFLKENARRVKEAGLEYNVFCWLHFPPKWYQASDRFVPYENLETGATIEQISLWSPDLPRVFDAFYRRLAEAVGDEIAFMRVAMPSEYGEVGYCAGMTDWIRKQPNAGRGYWCGDPYARADFRARMLKKYGTLEKLNAAWGTDFAAPEDIAMPDPKAIREKLAESYPARRRWSGFLTWYNEAWVHCMKTVDAIIRRYFPEDEMIYSLGYGTEHAVLGNDQGLYVKAMAEIGGSAQTPGNVGYLPTRRVSSACRHYGVPYYTEPPADVPRDRQLNRIFMDLANGVDCWFDYLQNLDRARDYFFEYKAHFTGADPRTTVALWLPSADHALHPEQGWPAQAEMIADPLRDLMAYEVVDDRLIRDGALDSLGIRHLILAGATWLDPETLDAVRRWVEDGGVLLALQGEAPKTVAGSTAPWDGLAPEKPADGAAHVSRSVGTGVVPEAYVIDVCGLHADGYTTGGWYEKESNGSRWTQPNAGLVLPVRPPHGLRASPGALHAAQFGHGGSRRGRSGARRARGPGEHAHHGPLHHGRRDPGDGDLPGRRLGAEGGRQQPRRPPVGRVHEQVAGEAGRYGG